MSSGIHCQLWWIPMSSNWQKELELFGWCLQNMEHCNGLTVQLKGLNMPGFMFWFFFSYLCSPYLPTPERQIGYPETCIIQQNCIALMTSRWVGSQHSESCFVFRTDYLHLHTTFSSRRCGVWHDTVICTPKLPLQIPLVFFFGFR